MKTLMVVALVMGTLGGMCRGQTNQTVTGGFGWKLGAKVPAVEFLFTNKHGELEFSYDTGTNGIFKTVMVAINSDRKVFGITGIARDINADQWWTMRQELAGTLDKKYGKLREYVDAPFLLTEFGTETNKAILMSHSNLLSHAIRYENSAITKQVRDRWDRAQTLAQKKSLPGL